MSDVLKKYIETRNGNVRLIDTSITSKIGGNHCEQGNGNRT